MADYRWIPVGDFKLGTKERQAIMGVVNSDHLSEWREVAGFESEFADYVGTKHCIAVNSGTSALIVMLKALQYMSRHPARAGTKIITSSLTYIATPAAIVAAGFEPVFVDVDPVRFGILPEQIEEVLARQNGEDFVGILPVHLMGYPVDMVALDKIAKKHSLVLLEDSAQAHGSTYCCQRTGSIGLAGAFSFYIAHNIQAGEMGAVTTNDDELAELVRSLKAHGRRCRCPVCRRDEGNCPYLDRTDEDDPRFTHDLLGYNFKTMEFQAALGRCQLARADVIFQARTHNVGRLNELLGEFTDHLHLPPLDENVSYLAYPIVVREGAPFSREQLCRALEKLGVENRPLFSCLPTHQPAFGYLRDQYQGTLPNAERLGKDAFYIGCHQFLTDEDLDYVAKAFGEVLAEISGSD